MSSHEFCWIRRGWTVTTAMCKPRLLFAWTEISSAALNRLATPARARANARSDRTSLRCPKAYSGAGAVDPHEVPTLAANHGVENRRRDLFHMRPVPSDGSLRGSRRSGRMQPVRRKTECGFTLARFSNLQAPENCPNRSPDRSARRYCGMKNAPQGNPEQNPMDLL